jgi:hypothetical protein
MSQSFNTKKNSAGAPHLVDPSLQVNWRHPPSMTAALVSMFEVDYQYAPNIRQLRGNLYYLKGFWGIGGETRRSLSAEPLGYAYPTDT